MANAFTITIFCADKATATMRAINKQISAMTRPFADVGRAAKSLAKEAGFERVAKHVREVGKATREAADRARSFVAPLAAITGAATVAGAFALARGFANIGFELKEALASIGVGSSQLQQLRGAAGMMEISAATLDGGLKSLGNTMEDALYGRNQDALVMMNTLGIRMRKNRDGALDTAGAFMDLAKAIAAQKSPQIQELIARQMGVESLLPILRKGPAAIREYMRAFKAAGAEMSPQQIEVSDRFHEQLAYLNMQMSGLKLTIAGKLMPVIAPLLDSFGKWATANREIIAANVAEVAKGLADALRQIDWKTVGQDILAIGQGIKTVVDLMGGWKNAMIALVLFMNAGTILSVLSLTKALFGLGGSLLGVGLRMALFARAGLAAGALQLATMTTGLGGLSEAFLGLGAAIEITPIGWILTGLVLLGGAIYLLWKHWDKVGPWLAGVWVKIQAGLGVAWSAIKRTAVAAWTELKDFFKGLWDDVVGLFDAGVKKVEALVDKVANAGRRLKGAADRFADKHPRLAHAAAAAGAFVVGGPTGLAIEEAGRTLHGAARRTKNPGNLRPVHSSTGWQQFDTYAAGLRAMSRQLLYDQNHHHIDTLRALIHKYAPPKENNTKAYYETVAKRAGMTPDQHFNLNDPQQLVRVQQAMISVESGNGRSPFSDDQILAAIGGKAPVQTGPAGSFAAASERHHVSVDVNVRGAGKGATASVRAPAKVPTSVRIDHSLPAGAPG